MLALASALQPKQSISIEYIPNFHLLNQRLYLRAIQYVDSMMWQDFVFMLGSSLSIVFLAPTLRDVSARVPLGTSLPSMLVGLAYAFTFMTLGMTFSAMGAAATTIMWSLIATYRSPGDTSPVTGSVAKATVFARDVWHEAKHRSLMP